MSNRSRPQLSGRISTDGSPYLSKVRCKLNDKKSPSRISGKHDDPLLSAGSLFPKIPQVPEYERVVVPQRRPSVPKVVDEQEHTFLRGPRDYSEQAVEPKVFAGWKNNDPSRAQLIGRRALQYQSVDYTELLIQEGVPNGDPFHSGSVLPIPAFYDGSADVYTPEEWI